MDIEIEIEQTEAATTLTLTGEYWTIIKPYYQTHRAMSPARVRLDSRHYGKKTLPALMQALVEAQGIVEELDQLTTPGELLDWAKKRRSGGDA